MRNSGFKCSVKWNLLSGGGAVKIDKSSIGRSGTVGKRKEKRGCGSRTMKE